MLGAPYIESVSFISCLGRPPVHGCWLEKPGGSALAVMTTCTPSLHLMLYFSIQEQECTLTSCKQPELQDNVCKFCHYKQSLCTYISRNNDIGCCSQHPKVYHARMQQSDCNNWVAGMWELSLGCVFQPWDSLMDYNLQVVNSLGS